MNSNDSNLDLFDSRVTQCFTTRNIPNSREREHLKTERKNKNLSHREVLGGYFAMIGIEFDQDKPIMSFHRRTSRVQTILLENDLVPNQFVLCFVDAGDASRNWISNHIEEIKLIFSHIGIKVLFIEKHSEISMGSLTDILELISISKFALTNDTGWAHCVIEMKKPLLVVSSTLNDNSDMYIRQTEVCKVLRPSRLLENCKTKCSEGEYHCISTVQLGELIEKIDSLL
jgi:ADP-heptose:LPS heptosyltransferase